MATLKMNLEHTNKAASVYLVAKDCPTCTDDAAECATCIANIRTKLELPAETTDVEVGTTWHRARATVDALLGHRPHYRPGGADEAAIAQLKATTTWQGLDPLKMHVDGHENVLTLDRAMFNGNGRQKKAPEGGLFPVRCWQ